jgi:phosphoribosylformimino-5-aminoimidazole carboxamide ribotide isomerase
MTRFRPCIDLHAGQVKQIVGGTLSTIENDLKTNHVSTLPAGNFADLYREKNALGAHVIMLGPGNEQAAMEALSAWPGHLQIGGGITDENAKKWIDAGAEKVVLCSSFQQPIITSIKSLLKPLRSYPRYRNGSGMVLTSK